MGVLADSVEQALAEGLLPRGATVLAACSGGADSVALAAVLAGRTGLNVALGHVDHGLRPESGKEAAQVRDLARRLCVPFHLETLAGLDVRGEGLEGAARTARYQALGRLASQAGARVVATAHTRRDQAETLLLRLIRGAGPGALAGIRRRRPLVSGIDLVRPLLGVSRDDTEAYCRENRLDFTQDPHNTDPRRARARLRQLWPLLAGLNPRIEEALAGAAESLAEEDELLSAMLPRELGLEVLRALPLPLLRRALMRGAIEAGLRPERPHLRGLQRLISMGKGTLHLPGGVATVASGAVRFARHEAAGGGQQPEAGPELAVPGPGSYAWRTRELVVVAGAGEGLTVDLARAPFPWTLRGHRPGDRFRPAGGRSRKVADLWIDAHLPRDVRASLALLIDARGQIFWVEGVRQGDAARPPMSHMAAFRISPEMKVVDGAFPLKRRGESRSATMDPRAKVPKEPR